MRSICGLSAPVDRSRSGTLVGLAPRPNVAYWPFASFRGNAGCRSLSEDCVAKHRFFLSGPICVLLSSWRSPPGASYGIIGPTLVDRLRRTGDCRRWRRAAEELDEAPQVLSGCGQ